jgi:hypothetical protein
MRHSATDAPRLHQYLAQERHRVIFREKCARPVDTRRSTIDVACPTPPIRALKVQVQQQYRATPGALTDKRVYLRPKVAQTVHAVQLDAGASGADRLRKQRDAPSVQTVRRLQHPHTGPPVRCHCCSA